MGRALTRSGEEELEETHFQNRHFKLCARSFRVLGFWVPKNLGKFHWAHKAGLSKRFSFSSSSSSSCCCCHEKKVFELYNGNVLNNSVFFEYSSHRFLEQEEEMECLGEIVEEGFCEEVNLGNNNNNNNNNNDDNIDNVNVNGIVETFGGLMGEKGRESSSSSDFLTSETNEEQSHCSCSEESESSSPTTLGWTVEKSEVQDCSSCSDSNKKCLDDDRSLEKQGSDISEMEMMKERFSKLLLGEDMSGSGNGVSAALSISNAITNLCATVFGQLWRLEPLPQEKKLMWRREMEWLLCVSDHIVELTPSWQTFPDGTKLEIMTCRPRADLYVNLPALRKLDNMLLEILDGFGSTEFWYVDQGIMAPDGDGASSFRRTVQRQVDKWWLPAPRVPQGGLHEDTRKQLRHKRDCTNQILKAAMAINSISLADMRVPDSYMESLPKNGRVCLGDITYRYISSEQFYPDCLLDCLDLSSEHQAVEIANRVESAIYMWRRKVNNAPKSNSRTSWEIVKDLMVDPDKRELLAERAESLLLCLRQRFPGLPQTALDMSKIQYNKDVGKSILESYSRVLESLAFNIVARIDDLLYVDDLSKRTADQNSPPPVSKFGLLSKTGGTPIPVPIPTTPYKTAFTTPIFSPARPTMSPRTGGEISRRRSGAKKVLTDFLSIDAKVNGQQLESTSQSEDKD